MPGRLRLPATAKGERFDQAIAAALEGASVREVRRAVKEGLITINGKKRAPGDRSKGEEDVDLSRFTARAGAELEPAPDLLAKVAVLFESKTLLALDKPSGMQTAPLRPFERDTLLSAAVARAPSIAEAGPPLEGGLLHRLDRDTSGVVLFAKTAAVREALRRAFQVHRVEKKYLAVVSDPGLKDRLSVESWLQQAGERVKIAAPHADGALHAATELRVLKRGRKLALIEATTFTGRRHQIRVHLANEGAPIAGDALYGDAELAPRLALHAASIQVPEQKVIESPFPAELEGLLK